MFTEQSVISTESKLVLKLKTSENDEKFVYIDVNYIQWTNTMLSQSLSIYFT